METVQDLCPNAYRDSLREEIHEWTHWIWDTFQCQRSLAYLSFSTSTKLERSSAERPARRRSALPASLCNAAMRTRLQHHHRRRRITPSGSATTTTTSALNSKFQAHGRRAHREVYKIENTHVLGCRCLPLRVIVQQKVDTRVAKIAHTWAHQLSVSSHSDTYTHSMLSPRQQHINREESMKASLKPSHEHSRGSNET
jgi:hypothetical protein